MSLSTRYTRIQRAYTFIDGRIAPVGCRGGSCLRRDEAEADDAAAHDRISVAISLFGDAELLCCQVANVMLLLACFSDLQPGKNPLRAASRPHFWQLWAASWQDSGSFRAALAAVWGLAVFSVDTSSSAWLSTMLSRAGWMDGQVQLRLALARRASSTDNQMETRPEFAALGAFRATLAADVEHPPEILRHGQLDGHGLVVRRRVGGQRRLERRHDALRHLRVAPGGRRHVGSSRRVVGRQRRRRRRSWQLRPGQERRQRQLLGLGRRLEGRPGPFPRGRQLLLLGPALPPALLPSPAVLPHLSGCCGLLLGVLGPLLLRRAAASIAPCKKVYGQ